MGKFAVRRGQREGLDVLRRDPLAGCGLGQLLGHGASFGLTLQPELVTAQGDPGGS